MSRHDKRSPWRPLDFGVPMTDQTAPQLDAALRRLGTAQLPFSARLADRIKHLAGAFAGDYDGRQLSVRSVAGLLDFLESTPPSDYPDLTLTPAGDCYAEWHGSQGHKVAIEFLDSGDARYLVFRPNPKHPQRVDRLTGTTTIDALAETMAPLAPLTGLAA
jgi:hypothetical protein